MIVGGGSAGWMTAAYLDGALNDRGQNPMVEITLVESPDVPRISVGEATVPSIHHVLEVVGIDEADFMKRTDATFKQSIKYVNWLDNSGEEYHHPFSRYTPGPIDRTGQRWLVSRRDIPFVETVSAQAVLSDINKAPKAFPQSTFRAPLKYAFHFDAQLYADYLCEIAVGRGVEHVRANVTGARRDDEGYIEAVRLSDGTDVAGDFFIDCTGFRSVLIEREMGVGWDSYAQWLLCNRAVVAQFPYESHFPGVVRPYTTCTAMSAGWIWDTPTQTRRAIGYVHSSDFIDEDAARAELLGYQDPELKDWETRTIHFKVGQREKVWTRNCMAIGLSSGFIEPLESTGIYLAELGAVLLAEHFPRCRADMEGHAFRVNRIVSNRYYEVLDFINLHYCLTRRTDTAFWREVAKPERINDRLKAKLDYWRTKSPSRSDFDDQSFAGFPFEGTRRSQDPEIDPRPPVDAAGLWDHTSYEAILYGMDFRGEEFAPLGDDRPPSRPTARVVDTIRGGAQALPPHHVWLHKTLGMTPWPTSAKPHGWSVTGAS